MTPHPHHGLTIAKRWGWIVLIIIAKNFNLRNRFGMAESYNQKKLPLQNGGQNHVKLHQTPRRDGIVLCGKGI
jgi:hypothetical protein